MLASMSLCDRPLDRRTIIEDLQPHKQGRSFLELRSTAGVKHVAVHRSHHDIDAIRSLNGRIDEFAILSRVLSPEEIRVMYEVGKPSS